MSTPLVVSVRTTVSTGAPGSIELPCSAGCGHKVWASEHALMVMERERCGIMCTDCALPIMEADPSSEFHTTDGSDVERILELVRRHGWPTDGV